MSIRPELRPANGYAFLALDTTSIQKTAARMSRQFGGNDLFEIAVETAVRVACECAGARFTSGTFLFPFHACAARTGSALVATELAGGLTTLRPTLESAPSATGRP